MSKVLIIVGSDSDLSKMADTAKVLEEFGVESEITISSAHRSPERTEELVENFQLQGGKVIICAAGMAAHLAGAVAAQFPLPVIGVPIEIGILNGVDALLSTMQMPPGIPVATVAINGTKNAGILAIQILATSDKQLEDKLVEYKKKMAMTVEEKAALMNKND